MPILTCALQIERPESQTPLQLESIDPVHEPGLKSLHSDVQVRVEFVNQRRRSVHLWWRDFQGRRISYGSLPPGQNMQMTTYVTHPWVITDEQSGAVLGIWMPASVPGVITIT